MNKGYFSVQNAFAFCVGGLICLGTLMPAASRAQTATWIGGNTSKPYSDPANWSPAGVPAGSAYTIIVPDNTSLSYDLGSNAVLDAVSLGLGSLFRLTNGYGLTVNGPALVQGQVEVNGGSFLAPANVTALQANPRLFANGGGQILVGASTYTWDRMNSAATLLSATGTNSLVDLKSVTSMLVSYGDSGAWTYSVLARTNGTVDLSGVSQVTGPSQDDWLEFRVSTGGRIKLDALRRLLGRTRFNIDVPSMTLPLLENATGSQLTLASNSTLNIPSLLTFDSGAFNLGQNAVVQADKLDTLTSSSVTVDRAGLLNAPKLASMDSVPVTLTADGIFRATNLVTYRNSDILFQPGRNFLPGRLTDINGSRLSVRGGSMYELGALTYNAPNDWRFSGNVLHADGAGSLLDASAMQTLRMEYGAGQFNYQITAENNGVVDLSGLLTSTGPSNSEDDWLIYNIRTGGNILLDSLRTVTRRTRFNVEVPRFDLPLLETADNTQFIIPDGARINATNLNRLETCSFTFGFNSTFNAPRLLNLIDIDMALGVGKILLAPPFTNIYGSRLSVSGGSVLRAAAPAYDCYQDWRWGPTIMSADGAGSLLDLASLQTLTVHGGHWDAWNYRVTANNNGVIDLSGLQRVYGGNPDNWGGDDTLEFNVRNGGSLILTSLREVYRRTRFNIEVPEFTLPSLEYAELTTFNLANGTRLNAPNLTRLQNCVINYGVGSVFNAPNLLNAQNMDIVVAPGRDVVFPPFTNINSARLWALGGSNLTVAATSYQTLPDWRWSPTLFLADGAGSRLSAASITRMVGSGGSGGVWNYWFTANNGGVLDLSGLQTVIGNDPSNYDGDDWFVFNVQTNGTILLNSLLWSAGNTRFNVGDNQILNAPSLVAVTNGTITLGFNSTFNASNLLTFVNSTMAYSPGKTFNIPPFTNIFASRISVAGGQTGTVAALEYDMYPDWRWGPTLLSSDGSGSLLNAASIKTFRVTGGHWDGWHYRVNALNSGTVDLSGLETAYGGDTPWGNDDWLNMSATSGGLIRLGNISVFRRAQFNANGPGSTLELRGMYLRSPSTINVNNRGLLIVKNNFTFDNTDPNSIQVSTATFQMDGTQPQTLEVGGKNLGPTGATSLNFGYSQLVIGNTNQSSIVRLQDVINNGQRGPGGESEALYLYGLDGQGLKLLNNSKLILNNVPVYALMGGQMRLLNSLVSPAANSVAFDFGILANSAGPRIISMTPSNAVTPPVSSVDVTFDIPIKVTTFTLADVTITGPAGAVAPTSIVPVSGNTYRINFAPQNTSGSYTVRVGPAINEQAENLTGMDQDADGLGGEATDDVFVASFPIDGLPPVVVSAFALQSGTRVGVTFNEAVAPAFATNPANYLVNGAAPSRAVLQTNGSQVALWVNSLVGESFTLEISNAADPLGNTANRSITGSILSLEARDIGTPGTNPREAGATLTFDGVDFETVAGGSDFFWNSSDAGHFVFETRPGDFDVRVQVARIVRAETYSQAGIMWRESTAANSRRIYACLNDPTSANNYWALIRYNPNESGAQFPGSPQPAIGSLPAWVRLKRAGNTFIAFRGTDGTNWIEYGRVVVDWPANGILGLATDARNNNAGAVATAQYRYYGDISPAIVSPPQGQSVASGASVVFGVTARGLPTLAYQWLFNGVPLSGATGNLFTLSSVTTANVGDYRVVITNSYGSVTSQIAALVVDGIGGGGFEGDVMPTPYGNNTVTVSDWTRIGRLVAGLDSVLSSSEFMRADSSPRTNAAAGTLPLGDGRLSVADWTQAGRYAAGLDPLTPAGGPNQAGGKFTLTTKSVAAEDSRLVEVLGRKVSIGQTFEALVRLSAQGDENALGLSLNFDPARLTFVGAVLAQEAGAASLQVNATAAGQGKVGLVIGKSAGQTFAAGTALVVKASFTALDPAGATDISIGDSPVIRELVSVTAEPQPVQFQGGAIVVVEPGRLSRPVLADGKVTLTLTGQAGETYRVEATSDLVNWELLSVQTVGSGAISIDDPAAAQVRQRFYRAVPQP